MASDTTVRFLDADWWKHETGEYRLRAIRPSRRPMGWPGEDKPAARLEVALLEALEAQEQHVVRYPAEVLRQEMARLVQAFMTSSYAHQLAVLHKEVEEVRREVAEFRRLVAPMRELDQGFDKELAALEGSLSPTAEAEEDGTYNFNALLDDLE